MTAPPTAARRRPAADLRHPAGGRRRWKRARRSRRRVHDVENHGVEKILTLRVGDTMLHATVPARTDLAIEEAVRFAWNPDKVVLFDQASGVSLRHAG